MGNAEGSSGVRILLRFGQTLLELQGRRVSCLPWGRGGPPGCAAGTLPGSPVWTGGPLSPAWNAPGEE